MLYSYNITVTIIGFVTVVYLPVIWYCLCQYMLGFFGGISGYILKAFLSDFFVVYSPKRDH